MRRFGKDIGSECRHQSMKKIADWRSVGVGFMSRGCPATNDYSLDHRCQSKRLSPMHDIVGSILSLPTHMKYCNRLSQRNIMMLLKTSALRAHTNKNMKNNVNKRWEFYVSFGAKRRHFIMLSIGTLAGN